MENIGKTYYDSMAARGLLRGTLDGDGVWIKASRRCHDPLGRM